MGLEVWIDRFKFLSESGFYVVALLPNATDAKWWHRAALHAREVILIQGRIQFLEGEDKRPRNSNTRGSCLMKFSPHWRAGDKIEMANLQEFMIRGNK
jgi:hypothetical protein